MRGGRIFFMIALIGLSLTSVHSTPLSDDFSLHEASMQISVGSRQPSFALNLSIIRLNTTTQGMHYLAVEVGNASEIAVFAQIPVTYEIAGDMVNFSLPTSIPPNTVIALSISGVLSAQDIQGQRVVRPSLVFSEPFSITTVEVQSDETIKQLLPANYRQTGENTFQWTFVSQRSIQLNVATDIAARESMVVGSQLENSNHSIALTISNQGDRPEVVEVIAPEWYSISHENRQQLRSMRISVEGHETVIVNVELMENVSRGKYYGTIFVVSRGEVIHRQDVVVSVNTGSLLSFLMVLIPSILMLGYAVHLRLRTSSEDREISAIERKIASLREPSVPKPKSIDQNALAVLFQEREQSLISYLFSHPGSSQQMVADHLGISKATASRIVNNLEMRGILERRKNGMSNKIYLNESMLRERNILR